MGVHALLPTHSASDPVEIGLLLASRCGRLEEGALRAAKKLILQEFFGIWLKKLLDIVRQRSHCERGAQQLVGRFIAAL